MEVSQWHTLIFDGLEWFQKTPDYKETFEEWMDDEHIAFPPCWSAFNHYCSTHYPNMQQQVKEVLWKDYAKTGFAICSEDGTVTKQFDLNGRPIPITRRAFM